MKSFEILLPLSLSCIDCVLKVFTLYFRVIMLPAQCSPDSDLITFVCSLPHEKVLQNTFSTARKATIRQQQINTFIDRVITQSAMLVYTHSIETGQR